MKAVNKLPFASSAEPHAYGCPVKTVRCIEWRHVFVVLTVFCVMLTVCGRHDNDFITGGTVDMTPATAWYEADSLYRAAYTGTDFINEGIDTLFGAYVTPDRGLVAYDSLYNSILFRSVVDSVAGLDLAVLTTYEDSLSFLINAYNVSVIYGIKRYGIISANQNDGVFFESNDYVFTVAGRTVTLNDLEKNDLDLIARFDDPRIHFVLVCGALGCPPLLNRSYRADSLYRQMDERSVHFMNDTEFNPVLTGNTAQVSELFSWYRSDFDGFTRTTATVSLLNAGGAGNERDFMVSYFAGADSTVKSDRVQNTAVSYVIYDWSLNGQ